MRFVLWRRQRAQSRPPESAQLSTPCATDFRFLRSAAITQLEALSSAFRVGRTPLGHIALCRKLWSDHLHDQADSRLARGDLPCDDLKQLYRCDRPDHERREPIFFIPVAKPTCAGIRLFPFSGVYGRINHLHKSMLWPALQVVASTFEGVEGGLRIRRGPSWRTLSQ